MKDAHHEPREMSTNVPTAQLDATKAPGDERIPLVSVIMMGSEAIKSSPADSPRTTPTPAPLAMPVSRLFRAQGTVSISFSGPSEAMF